MILLHYIFYRCFLFIDVIPNISGDLNYIFCSVTTSISPQVFMAGCLLWCLYSPLLSDPFSGPNATFVVSDSTMSWTDAQSYCRNNHTDLASVRNLEENQQLLDALSGIELAWIGLYRDSWKWLDGSNSSLRYWAGAEPTGPETCVAADFHNSGKWEGFDCGLKKPFICYSE